MAAEFPLSLIIKAVDKATAPLAEMNKKLHAFTAPVRKLNNSLHALAEESGLKHVGHAMEKVGHSIQHVGHAAMEVAERFLFMEGVGGFALYELIKGSVEAGAELEKMANRLGLTVDAYAQLRYSAAQADVEQEEFNSAMDKLNKNLADARMGTGEFYSFLAGASPVLAQQIRHTKNMEEAIGLLESAMEKVKDPATRARLSIAAMGKGGKALAEWMHQGNAKIAEQRKRYMEIAGTQGEFAEKSVKLRRTLLDTGLAFTSVKNAVVSEFYPAVDMIAKAVTNFIGLHRDSLIEWAKKTAKQIEDWVEGGGLDRLADNIGKISDKVGDLIDNLGGIGGVAKIAAFWMATPLFTAAISLAGAMLKLGAAMGASMASMNIFLAAAVSVGAAIYAITKNWNELKEAFTTRQGAANMGHALADMFALAPGESLDTAWKYWKNEAGSGFGLLDPTAHPPTNAAAGAPAQAARGATYLTVDFSNLPRGARVTADPGKGPGIDLNVGYSNLVPE